MEIPLPLAPRLALAASLLATPALAAEHDTLTIGAAQFPQGMHPNLTGQDILTYAAGFALKRVTTFDSAGQIVCQLCTTVPTLENGLAKREGDGLAVTIQLRPGLAWGDGAPVTARDIAYTWRVARDPAVGFIATHPWTRATSVEVVDDHTAVLHLDHTYTNFPLWDEVLSEHADSPALAAGDYANHTPYNRDPTNPGLWDGPYMPTAYRVNQAIEYAPNPHWPGPGPGFKRLTLRLVENTAALQANLLSGDVDMTPSGTGLTIDQAVALEKSSGDRFRFLYRPQLSYEHIEPRLDNPILASRDVREALLRAIDVPAIVTKLFAGHAEVARSFINGLDPHYDADVPTYPYDPARARALLEQAGWTPGPDGIRRNAAGDKLSLEFATTAGNRVRELTQQVMQSQWRAVGVEVTIHNQPARTFFGQLLKHRDFSGMAEYASTLEPLLVPWLRLSSAYIPSQANNWGGQNYAGITDKELDALIAAAQYELDPAKQQALWTQMQQIYATKLYHLPLYFRADPDIIPRWLQGYTATGKETYVSFFAENWRP
jgi:peptide/nickel transport system substrate-binding protein